VKIGILGDLQLTNRSPERRLDNYFETLKDKLQQAFTIFKENSCSCVIQVGDFCDSPTIANRVISSIIEVLIHGLYPISLYDPIDPLCCVYGQHDISGHSKSTLPNSPLAVFESAGLIKMLDDNPHIVGLVSEGSETSVALYGSSFGEGIPKPFEDNYNVLVTHRMIGNRPLWPGQELVGPRQFLRKYPEYNLICCGDYHYRFFETWNGRTIVNPGAIVRKTISKFDLEHKPAVVIFDTNTSKLEVVELDVKPVEEVFDLTRDIKKKDSEILSQLVEKLKQGGKKLSGWKHFLVRVLEERKANKKVRDIIDQSLEEVKE